MKIAIALLSALLICSNGFASSADTGKQQQRQAELSQMNKQALTTYLAQGMAPDIKRDIAFVMTSTDEQKLKTLKGKMESKGQKAGKVWVLKKDGDTTHYVLEFMLKLTLNDSEKLLNYSELVDKIAQENEVYFIGWAARQ